MIRKFIQHNFNRRFKFPASMILHVTRNCDYNCTHCFSKHINQINLEQMGLSEIEIVAKSVPRLLYLNISGGEPFKRSDLADICYIFSKHCKLQWISIPTNGSEPQTIYDVTRKILQNSGNVSISVDLSLHGMVEVHDSTTTVKGSFENLIKTYEKLKKLKTECRSLHIKIITLISKENVSGLRRIHDYVRYRMPEVLCHTFIFPRFSKNNEKVLGNSEEISAIKSILYKSSRFINSDGMPFYRRLIIEALRQKVWDENIKVITGQRNNNVCRIADTSVVVWSNGDVSFCEIRPVIENLRKYNFNLKSLWYSDSSLKERRLIVSERCYCTHECAALDNLVFNPLRYPAIIWQIFLNIISYLRRKGH